MTQPLPVLGIARMVLFPGMRCSVALASKRARAAVEAARLASPAELAVIAARPGSLGDPDPQDLFEVGVRAAVISVERRPCCGRIVAEIETQGRVRAVAWTRDIPFREASCEILLEPEQDPGPLFALRAGIVEAARQMHALFPDCRHTSRALGYALEAPGPDAFPGAVLDLLQHVQVADLQSLLELEPLSARLEGTLRELHARLALSGPSLEPGTLN